jgi:hypothetical protein
MLQEFFPTFIIGISTAHSKKIFKHVRVFLCVLVFFLFLEKDVSMKEKTKKRIEGVQVKTKKRVKEAKEKRKKRVKEAKKKTKRRAEEVKEKKRIV